MPHLTHYCVSSQLLRPLPYQALYIPVPWERGIELKGAGGMAGRTEQGPTGSSHGLGNSYPKLCATSPPAYCHRHTAHHRKVSDNKSNYLLKI